MGLLVFTLTSHLLYQSEQSCLGGSAILDKDLGVVDREISRPALINCIVHGKSTASSYNIVFKPIGFQATLC
ncbi:hypothetical protein XELAEV_18032284mg [Xenopus laevis]|uniref:Uncharacterized protein n=1 Tax=Xenopus laevis TaxID=8355 RepID=A0A974HGG8_XENLA|nr:hypothetical protein XELAEV_18032284mg [Xenopus laevis]